MKILSLSDGEVDFIYSPMVRSRFQDVDILIDCGDLSYYYFEYVVSMLNVPAYFVRGNHQQRIEYGAGDTRTQPWGAIDLHRCCVRDPSGLLVAGIEGSLRYNDGEFQYGQGAMWRMALRLVPGLLKNYVLYGRYLDVFVSHAPPWKIHDQEDLPHQGIKAFRWLITVFQPRVHLHGHIHVYGPTSERETWVNKTRVINSYLFHETIVEI